MAPNIIRPSKPHFKIVSMGLHPTGTRVYLVHDVATGETGEDGKAVMKEVEVDISNLCTRAQIDLSATDMPRLQLDGMNEELHALIADTACEVNIEVLDTSHLGRLTAREKAISEVCGMLREVLDSFDEDELHCTIENLIDRLQPEPRVGPVTASAYDPATGFKTTTTNKENGHDAD